jgi:hypothetical protein
MPLNTKLVLWITAIAVLGYAARTYYDCAHDPNCHLVYCGSAKPRMCGLSYAPPSTP